MTDTESIFGNIETFGALLMEVESAKILHGWLVHKTSQLGFNEGFCKLKLFEKTKTSIQIITLIKIIVNIKEKITFLKRIISIKNRDILLKQLRFGTYSVLPTINYTILNKEEERH